MFEINKLQKKIYLLSFGCQMNEYDSELVRAIMREAGYEFTDDEMAADIIMLNTCSVRENAHNKVYGHIHELRHRLRRVGRSELWSAAHNSVLIGILGCMATGLREELLNNKQLALDFVVGPDSYKRLPVILEALIARGPRSAVSGQPGSVSLHGSVKGEKVKGEKVKGGPYVHPSPFYPLPMSAPDTAADLPTSSSPGYDVTLSEFETYADVYPAREAGVNAWVAVMRGCNNFCSFCIVPFTRGRERSRSVANIVEEVRRLAGEGFPQVTLLGQNVNSYQHDGKDFAALLEAVAKVDGIRRIRFTSPHPKDLPESLIRVMAENPKVCKQLHLPLQAGNDRVLKLMQRNYTGDEFLALVMKLRRACPHLTLTTDVIVGFPTETAAEFEDTVRVMRAVEFDSAFMFKYSVRPNTRAARELKDDVPDAEKTRRIVELNMLQTDISLKKNKALVGQLHEVLVEVSGGSSGHENPDEAGTGANVSKGRTTYGRNDANKIVTITSGNARPGQFLPVRIIRATPHQLKGDLAQT